MTTNNTKPEVIAVKSDEDVILARQKVRAVAQAQGFGMLDLTRIVTAVSELARNMVLYAGGGTVSVEQLGPRTGIRIVFADQGPGIADVTQALSEGFSTNKSMGLGLSGSRKLVDEFDIQSAPGKGTTVTVVKWLNG